MLSLSGCYYLRQAQGQVDILLNREPIEETLKRPDLKPHEKRKLRLILDSKHFGETEVRLNQTDNYSTYYHVNQRHVSYVISACEPHSFRSYIWSFPIVGSLPYKGFFDRKDAMREAKSLKDDGYDITIRPVSAYSTLGWFSDPVLSTMLRQDDVDLINLILHELTHSTLYIPGKAEFNENLASFVGNTASLQYIQLNYGVESELYHRAIGWIADREMYANFISAVLQDLGVLYKKRLPREESVRLRNQILLESKKRYQKSIQPKMNTDRFDYYLWMELNNAVLLAERRYANDDPYRKMFESVGGDWKQFWEKMRAQRTEYRGRDKGR